MCVTAAVIALTTLNFSRLATLSAIPIRPRRSERSRQIVEDDGNDDALDTVDRTLQEQSLRALSVTEVPFPLFLDFLTFTTEICILRLLVPTIARPFVPSLARQNVLKLKWHP